MGKVNQLLQDKRTKIERDYCDGLISREMAFTELYLLGVERGKATDILNAIDEYNERGDGGQFGLGA